GSESALTLDDAAIFDQASALRSSLRATTPSLAKGGQGGLGNKETLSAFSTPCPQVAPEGAPMIHATDGKPSTNVQSSMAARSIPATSNPASIPYPSQPL